MNQIKSLFTLRLKASAVLDLITHLLEADGLRVICSFDFQAACSSFDMNICPDHGETPCDCQMVVLLVYGADSRPLSLVVHGHNGRVQVGIKEEQGDADRAFESRVNRLLDTNNIVREARRQSLAKSQT